MTEVTKTTIAAREFFASIPLSWYNDNKLVPTLLSDATATKQATNNSKHCYSRAKHMIFPHTFTRPDNLADFMVKPYTKTFHRSRTRQLKDVHQQLEIRFTCS